MGLKGPSLPSCFLSVATLVAFLGSTMCQGNDSVALNGSDGLEIPDLSNLHRVKRRTQQPGMFFPIAMYTVRHHRPGGPRARRPETWEYRGQYFYGYRPRTGSGRRRAARLLAAGLPLLLAPILGILFSYPVVVPVTQMATFGSGPGGQISGPIFGRRKREVNQKWKEMEAVSSYLKQVEYDERQQSRVMVNYLQCNGLLGEDDHCLERLSCEFGDPANELAPELERTVTSILLGHMLNNEFIPRPFKRRLKTAASHGRNNTGRCFKYFCNYVDNDWDFTSMPPEQYKPTKKILKKMPRGR